MILSIEAKRIGTDSWEAYVDNGRERTGRDVLAWAREAQERGAGEILLTSIDRDGTRKGFDLELSARLRESVTIPVIVSGGAGTEAHVAEMVRACRPSGVGLAAALHYEIFTIGRLEEYLQGEKIAVRPGQPVSRGGE